MPWARRFELVPDSSFVDVCKEMRIDKKSFQEMKKIARDLFIRISNEFAVYPNSTISGSDKMTGTHDLHDGHVPRQSEFADILCRPMLACKELCYLIRAQNVVGVVPLGFIIR